MSDSQSIVWGAPLLAAARQAAYASGSGTHLPLLASVLAVARPGPVLEVGTGHCSSPLIAEMCAAMGRVWSAVDQDVVWTEVVRDLKPTTAERVPSYEVLADWDDIWSVVFVDCSPGPSRLPVVRSLLSKAEFIVIHDTDNAGGDVGDLVEFLHACPHEYTYTRMRPWTTVVSAVRAYPGGGT